MPLVKLNVQLEVKVGKDHQDPKAWATKYVKDALEGKNRVQAKTIVIMSDGQVQSLDPAPSA